ncbi:MAG: hypothetical protein ACRBB0_09095 [Pelagimonas sp.]|uniref:hypothetical protein n=1 Tax=Pelagimonas sp. TaxID=2073170 RepID=UPI003D6AFE69
MQLKISQMLDEQAQELEAEATDFAPDEQQSEQAERQSAPVDKAEQNPPQQSPTGKSVELSEEPPLPALKPTLPAYEEAASMSRSDVLRTLP